ncbi:vesicle-associated membrane protein 3-like [Gouania willdenowi]|uniref:vesicle-associated membrane protein 3-like n=1 Tax=Gouania willdenowi TaxID=441366 RepID=UPI0010550C16|nr:vesicle-associated membrane protein 3-like [Gouania willdenowi]
MGWGRFSLGGLAFGGFWCQVGALGGLAGSACQLGRSWWVCGYGPAGLGFVGLCRLWAVRTTYQNDGLTGTPGGLLLLGPEGQGAAPSNKRLQQTQAQVDEVVDIIRVNVDKALDRDQKLSELDDRADALQAGASQFETSAAKLKRKYWWKNCKMWAILIAVVAIIVLIIIIWACS